MENRSQRNASGPKRWFARLDRTAGELNAFLLVLAIGLAVLDATYFVAFAVRDALPSATRIGLDPSVAAKPAVVPGASSSDKSGLAALAPTKPSAAVTGW